MQRADALIAATGTVVLVIAIAGSFFYASEDTLGAYAVDFPTETVDVARTDAEMPVPSAPLGGTTRVEIPVRVATPNLTTLEFAFEIGRPAAFAGQADFRFRLIDPDGEEAESGSFETLTTQDTVATDVTVPLGNAPSARQVEAASPAGAEAATAAEAAWRGMGNWTVVIEGSTTGSGSGVFPVHVHVAGEAYRAQAAPAPGTPR